MVVAEPKGEVDVGGFGLGFLFALAHGAVEVGVPLSECVSKDTSGAGINLFPNTVLRNLFDEPCCQC